MGADRAIHTCSYGGSPCRVGLRKLDALFCHFLGSGFVEVRALKPPGSAIALEHVTDRKPDPARLNELH